MENNSLIVKPSFRQDVGRGKVRIDKKTMERLNLKAGDFVKIKGKKQTVAQVLPSYEEEEGIIRLDGIQRQNANVSIGDRVRVEKVEVKEANKVVLAPTTPIRFGIDFVNYVKKVVRGTAVMKRDLLQIPVFGQSLPLTVVNVQPAGPVVITENTHVEIQNEPVEELANIPTVTYDDIGGLKEEIAKIREMVELPLRHPELFERLGLNHLRVYCSTDHRVLVRRCWLRLWQTKQTLTSIT